MLTQSECHILMSGAGIRKGTLPVEMSLWHRLFHLPTWLKVWSTVILCSEKGPRGLVAIASEATAPAAPVVFVQCLQGVSSWCSSVFFHYQVTAWPLWCPEFWNRIVAVMMLTYYFGLLCTWKMKMQAKFKSMERCGLILKAFPLLLFCNSLLLIINHLWIHTSVSLYLSFLSPSASSFFSPSVC